MTPEQISIIVGAIFGIVAFSVSLAYTIKALKKKNHLTKIHQLVLK